MNVTEIKKSLGNKRLKITPQRLAVLGAVTELGNHPTADNIVDYIRKNHPNIAIGTVYNILDTLVENKIIKRVKTDKDIMRYDAVTVKHHHLYCSESERIEDYFDDRLNKIIENYFRKKKIQNFVIEDIKLQIIGKFKKSKTN